MAKTLETTTAAAADPVVTPDIDKDVLPYITQVAVNKLVTEKKTDKATLKKAAPHVTLRTARMAIDILAADPVSGDGDGSADGKEGETVTTADTTKETPAETPKTKAAPAPKTKTTTTKTTTTKTKTTPADTAGIGNPSAPTGVVDAGISVEDK